MEAEHGVTFDFVFQLLGQGKLCVVSYGPIVGTTDSQTDICVLPNVPVVHDIFRLENHLIVEHWDTRRSYA